METQLLFAVLVLSLVYAGAAAMAHPRLMAGIVLFSGAIEATLGYAPHVSVGPFNVYMNDGIAGALVLAFAYRFWPRRAEWLEDALRQLILVFSGLVTFSLVRGLPAYGETAIAEARPYIYFVSGLLYFSSFRYRRNDLVKVFWMFAATAAFMSTLVMFRGMSWSMQPVGVQTPFDFVALKRATIGFGHGVTILSLLMSLFIIALNGLAKGKGLVIWSATGVLAFSLLLTNLRTLWVTGVICSMVIVLRYRARGLGRLLLYSSAIIALGLLLSFIFSDAASRLMGTWSGAIKEPLFSPTSSLAWRVQGWISLLSHVPMENYILGAPFGRGFHRVVFGQLVVVSPHNFYVRHVLRVGVIGLLTFVAAYVLVLARLTMLGGAAKSLRDRVISDVLLLSLVAHMTIYMVWAAMFSYALILGISVAVLSSPSLSVTEAGMTRDNLFRLARQRRLSV